MLGQSCHLQFVAFWYLVVQCVLSYVQQVMDENGTGYISLPDVEGQWRREGVLSGYKLDKPLIRLYL